MGKKNMKDLRGQKFHFLTALEPTEERSGSSVKWKCQCKCGNKCEVDSNNLTTLHTYSFVFNCGSATELVD